MNPPIFSDIEVTTLIKAVEYLQGNMDQALADDFADSGYQILTDETRLGQLESKLEHCAQTRINQG